MTIPPIENLPDSISPDQNPAEKNRGGDQLPPLPAQVPPSPTNQQKSRNGGYQKTPWWKIILEVVGVSAAVAAVIVAGYYAHIAKQQLNTQIRGMVIDNRPWIDWGSFSGHIHFPNPDDFYFDTSFLNVGKTPALDVHIRVNYKIVPKGGDGKFNFTLRDIGFPVERRDANEFNAWSAGAFNPSRNAAWQPPRFYFENKISTEEWQQLLRGAKRLYFFVEVTYGDVFHRPLYSHFCVYYPPGLAPPVVGCDIYNDVSTEQ